MKNQNLYSKIAKAAAKFTGRPIVFNLAVLTIVIWIVTGPIFHFSDTWQLVINTGTTIITFLMVFLIQNAQNRDTEAIQIKLDELIRATKGAHNMLLDLEELEEETLDEYRARYESLAKKAREANIMGNDDTDNEELEKVSGIFNGTTNYILTKTIAEKLSYSDALKQAQDKGFAESDPTNDVEGFDAKFKAIIIALHAFGLIIKPEEVLNLGITTLHDNDIKYASEKGYKIKLTPIIQRLEDDKVSVFVAPRFIKENNHLYNVDNEFNGVIVEGKFSGEQFLQGRGAGSYPTGAAVLSDISALSHGYKYEFKKYAQKHAPSFTNDVDIEVYFRYNSSEDLKHIVFNEISEKYTGKD